MVKLIADYKGEKANVSRQEPHRHSDGMYVASATRFEVDYMRVETTEELTALLQQGYSIRMSSRAPKTSPSLISPKNVTVVDSEGGHKARGLTGLLDDVSETDDLDKTTLATARKEQQMLRALLFQGKSQEECTLCQQVYPANLLVAAHIKPRANCSVAERKDYRNIVTPMCKFGCDDLYEKGYLCVVQGKVVENSNRPTTAALERYTAGIVGNIVNNWGTSQGYYHHHAKHHLGKKRFAELEE